MDADGYVVRTYILTYKGIFYVRDAGNRWYKAVEMGVYAEIFALAISCVLR